MSRRSEDWTREELRILIAIDEKRFGVNKAGRYVIEGEERPDRKTRESMQARGLIDWLYKRVPNSRDWQTVWHVTPLGEHVMKRAGVWFESRSEARP